MIDKGALMKKRNSLSFDDTWNNLKEHVKNCILNHTCYLLIDHEDIKTYVCNDEEVPMYSPDKQSL